MHAHNVNWQLTMFGLVLSLVAHVALADTDEEDGPLFPKPPWLTGAVQDVLWEIAAKVNKSDHYIPVQ